MAMGTGLDRAGHVQGFSQLHGSTFCGQKGAGEISPIDAYRDHGFHGNLSSLSLRGVDAIRRALTWQPHTGVNPA